MERTFADALKAAEISPTDRAGVQLARRYAQLLDKARGADGEVDVYNALGPKLLAALSALGLTVAGRVASRTGVGGGGKDARAGSTKLDELRARRGRTG